MTIYDKMVALFAEKRGVSNQNVEQEVMQRIALAGLCRGGFFQHAAFYGGTCLRLFHDLPRFSEDMDFTLTEKRNDIHIENYFPSIINEFRMAGHEVSIVKKEKKFFGRVESAFLKENTEAYDIKFQTEKTLKVKIEVDIDPPLGFATEEFLQQLPYTFSTRCLTLPYLFAGKMHALAYRAWKNRVKGRDWYDFEWYVRWRVPLDFRHLQDRICEFSGETISKETFMENLRNRLATTDIEKVKADVIHFVDNPHELDIWSNDYFLQLADMIVFK